MMKVWHFCWTASPLLLQDLLCSHLWQLLLYSHLQQDPLRSHLHIMHLHHQSSGQSVTSQLLNVWHSRCSLVKDMVTLLHLALLPLQGRQLEQKLLYLLVVPQLFLVSLQLTAMRTKTEYFEEESSRHGWSVLGSSALPLHNLDFRSQFLDLGVLLLFGFSFLLKTGK